jgi:hypothetical protein
MRGQLSGGCILLMDPKRYPRRAVAARYRSRWDIELRIGALKTTLKMNVLRSKSPKAARREVASIILGHNLVWMLMHQAARQTHRRVDRISLAGAGWGLAPDAPAHCPPEESPSAGSS